jgi:hypothetical protein
MFLTHFDVPHLIKNAAQLKSLAEIVGAVIGTGFTLISIAIRLSKWLRRRSDIKALRNRIGSGLYTREDILRATEFFVEPDCQSVDPSGGEDFRKVFSTREPAFKALDKLFKSGIGEKHTIILADSGMGKSTLLLNYYARHYRRRRPPFRLAIVPFGSKDADKEIASIEHRSDTVLFLDAFDEDTLAIQDHKTRLAYILEMTKDFQHVLFTCRTQFFEKDDETPKETGLIRIGTTRAGQAREYTFLKLYLSPFSYEQVESYLRSRFPFWDFRRRNKAREIVSKTADLTVRPMLLAHIQDMLDSKTPCIYTVQIYESMIEAWLVREKPFVNPSNLRRFSAELAMDIYTKREQRGSERIPPIEAMNLATKLAIPLQGWQLRGRSLLNRDADGYLKFAHRTVMEYLFVSRFIRDAKSAKASIWTDQIKKFWWESIICKYHDNNQSVRNSERSQEVQKLIYHGITLGDLRGIEFLSLQPLVSLSSTPLVHKDEYSLLLYITQHLDTNQTFHTRSKYIPGLLLNTDMNDLRQNGSNIHVVIDYATGLMWLSKCSDIVNYDSALRIAQKLEDQSSPSMKGWRIPSLIEVMSLLPTMGVSPEKFSVKPTSMIFERWEDVIWTSDRLEKSEALKCGFGSTDFATRGGKASLLCVRTIER